MAFLKSTFKNLGEKPLVIMKKNVDEKRKLRRRDRKVIRGKKFRETVKPEVSTLSLPFLLKIFKI